MSRCHSRNLRQRRTTGQTFATGDAPWRLLRAGPADRGLADGPPTDLAVVVQGHVQQRRFGERHGPDTVPQPLTQLVDAQPDNPLPSGKVGRGHA